MAKGARTRRPAELAGAERRHHYVLVNARRGRRLDQRDRRVAVCAALRLSTTDMRATLLHAAAATTSAIAASPSAQRSLRLTTTETQ